MDMHFSIQIATALLAVVTIFVFARRAMRRAYVRARIAERLCTHGPRRPT